jgi:DHA1 family bicyclomycin/chloramphenicol resistance-like MFS transporter
VLTQSSTQQRQERWIVLLLGLLCAVPPFAIDMYLPAFSHIAAEYNVPTAKISFSLSTFYVGFAVGQLAYGPLLDRFGRKKPLYLGLAVFILASIGCALAPSLRTFAAIRFLEALGGCAGRVGAVAMVRDYFPVERIAKIFSFLFLAIGVSPLLAPMIGSLMMTTFGWRWIFALLAAIGLVILALTRFLPETHTPDQSVSLRLWPIVKDFWAILKEPQFLTYVLAGAFSFAGLYAFVAGSPIIFIDGYHMGPRAFGGVFAALVMGFIGGSQMNVYLLRSFKSRQIFSAALLAQVTVGLLFLAGTATHTVGLTATLILLFLYLSCIGLTNPNAAALGLARFSRDAGRASALLGFLQMGIGALISMGIGLLGAHALVYLVSLTAIVAMAVLLAGRRRVAQAIETHEHDQEVALLE